MDQLCEVCGRASVQMTRDLIEVAPIDGRADPNWHAWTDGGAHYRCERHRRTPKRTYLDGTSTGGVDLDEGQAVPSSGMGAMMGVTMEGLREFDVQDR